MGVCEEYKENAEKLKREQLNWLEMLKENKELIEKIKEIELNISVEILKQIDEKGKRLFPNEALRREQLSNQLRENEKYNRIKQRQDRLETDMLKTQYEIEFIRNMLQLLRCKDGL